MKKSMICSAVLTAGLLLTVNPAVNASAADVDMSAQVAREAAGDTSATRQVSMTPENTAVTEEDQAANGAYIQSDAVFKTAGLGSGQLTGTYRLAKYDVINISILGFPNGLGYSTGSTTNASANDLRIGPDGNVSLPYVGTVPLAGLTLDEAKQVIGDKLSTYIRIPAMSVSVRSYAPRKVYVMGEVNNPGIKELGIDNLNAYAALTSAGSWNRRGRSTRVQVIRVIDGTMYYTQLNMKKYIKNHDLTQNVALEDGDIVYVPKSNGIKFDADVLPYVNAWALYKNLTD